MAYLKEHEVHSAEDGGYTSNVFYMENAQGRVMVEACVKCDHARVSCLHQNMNWDPEGTVLTCDLCGVDGT